MQEFELISRYFKGRGVTRKDVQLGIGDDCALVSIPDTHQLAITTDTLVSGVHFFPDIDPYDLGHRVLAVNLSDLAAMGAEPTWVSLALTLPDVNIDWLERFTQGLHDTAEYYNVQIIGGDTTQGPLTITINANGIVPKGRAITRSGANNGDWVYVSGPLGDAGAAIDYKLGKLSLTQSQFEQVAVRFNRPTPRVAAGQVIRGMASAAVDISDGLLADLGHICRLSGVGARINIDAIPHSGVLAEALDYDARKPYLLAYGDDYELCFTVPEQYRNALELNLKQYGVEAVCIGQITSTQGEIELFELGKPCQFEFQGFEHFKND